MKKIFRSEIAFLTHANDEWIFLFSSRPLSFVIVDQSVSHVIYFIITIQLMVPLFSMLLFPYCICSFVESYNAHILLRKYTPHIENMVPDEGYYIGPDE